jgi:hypothetical protein
MDSDLRETHGRKQTCRCPRCKKLHKAKINWTGRNMVPPIFCLGCRENIERSDYSECPIWQVPARAIEYAV